MPWCGGGNRRTICAAAYESRGVAPTDMLHQCADPVQYRHGAGSPLRICCINAPILYNTDMARGRPYGYAASMRRSCTIQTWHGVALPTNGQRTSHGHEHGPCPLVARSRPWRAQRNGACAAVSPGYASPLYRLAGSSKPSQLGNPGSLPVAGFLRSTGTLKRPLVYRRSVTCCHG